MHSQANKFSREVSRHFDSYFKEYHLATSYIELLLYLQDQAPVLQKEIADHLKLDPSTITRFIKKLERSKWVVKRKRSGRVQVELSSDKQSVVTEIRDKYEEAERDLERILGDKFTETTKRLLDHGNHLFDEYSGS